MNCEDVRRRLAELELGDLDAEPARDAEAHLAGCGACRESRERTARVLGALRAAARVAPSTERRLAAVQKMTLAAASASSPRFRPAPWIAAGAFLLALGAGFLLRDPAPRFEVLSLTGRVDRLDRRSGEWRPLSVGEQAGPGDRVVCAPGARVELGLPGGDGLLSIDPETSVDLVGGARAALDRGRLTAVRSGSGGRPFRVTDTANNYVEIRAGRVEIGLREVVALVAGSSERREGGSLVPAPQSRKAARLRVRVIEGQADLGGSHEQRLLVREGQEGTFDFGGQPSALPFRDEGGR
jgi:hypothetical protein